MAITDISEPTKFRRLLMGLAGDVKPTGTEYIGAFFIESDTGIISVTQDGTTWSPINIGAGDATAAELAKVPKSDGAVSWNATALAAINAQIDLALQTIVPAAPVAGSLNDILSKASGGNTFVKATDSLEMLSDKIGAYSGDGGAAADDSVKAEVDLVKTQTDKLAGATPTVGTTAAMNLFAGVATSGETGADLVTIGANDVKNKVLSFLIDSTSITAAATITVRLYTQINGTARKVYSQSFIMGTDTVGLWIIQGAVGIHEALRVEVQSSAAGDTSVTLGYDYMLEVM